MTIEIALTEHEARLLVSAAKSIAKLKTDEREKTDKRTLEAIARNIEIKLLTSR